ncbi:hypothetical protein [Natronobiforma cellulositropha]|uniref:hypothetical protein n=1 Tax=Natronobiforma cellulositropha TaxID=1679076 RepID=UPI0021D5E247|nr:hypothetical protein [Natronobiforma cellulositropha]
MTEPDVDKEHLQEELGQIKQAMGLAEAHPYWVRTWLIEGVSVGVLFPLFQLGLRDGFEPWLLVTLAGVFALYVLVSRWAKRTSEDPTTGVPSWTTWHVVVFAGIGALVVGLGPLFAQLDEASSQTLAMVLGGTVVGVGYMYMGQILEGYAVRRADRNAFYVGGAWILVLTGFIPRIDAVTGWEFAVLGIGIAIYGIVAYLVLSRI